MPLPEVTLARAEAWVKANDLNYKIDDDGDIAAGFDDVIMFIHVEDGLLRTHGYWDHRFNPQTHLASVTAAANEMNGNVVIPKTVVNPTGVVIFEYTAFTGDGMTDEQLGSALNSAFSATFQVAEQLAKELPDLASQEENK